MFTNIENGTVNEPNGRFVEMYKASNIKKFLNLLAYSTDPRYPDCIIFTGRKDKDGYGKFDLHSAKYGRETIQASRYALQFAYCGELRKDIFSMHSCDNPGCVWLHHLDHGTHQENMMDMVAKGRASSIMTNIKLTQADADEIRAKGYNCNQVMELYGVARTTAYEVIRRITWNFEDPDNHGPCNCGYSEDAAIKENLLTLVVKDK